VRAKLYSLSLSHPAHAARLMLELKKVEHEVVDCLPGMHPVQVRFAGFRGSTVPALRLDGRRIQGSREISRALDQLVPEPRLFPVDHQRRAAVEAAEQWGARELQPVPRKLFRWGVANRREMRVWMAREVARMPAPGLMAWANVPVARYFARVSAATDDEVRGALAALPSQLDRVDRLIAEGVIGDGAAPNAADFQILCSVRALLAMEDLRARIESRPCAAAAMRIQPDFPGPVPRFLPADWV